MLVVCAHRVSRSCGGNPGSAGRVRLLRRVRHSPARLLRGCGRRGRLSGARAPGAKKPMAAGGICNDDGLPMPGRGRGDAPRGTLACGCERKICTGWRSASAWLQPRYICSCRGSRLWLRSRRRRHRPPDPLVSPWGHPLRQPRPSLRSSRRQRRRSMRSSRRQRRRSMRSSRRQRRSGRTPLPRRCRASGIPISLRSGPARGHSPSSSVRPGRRELSAKRAPASSSQATAAC